MASALKRREYRAGWKPALPEEEALTEEGLLREVGMGVLLDWLINVV